MVKGFCGDGEVQVDAKAQDDWGLGCIIMLVYGERDLFNISSPHVGDYRRLHDRWVSHRLKCV